MLGVKCMEKYRMIDGLDSLESFAKQLSSFLFEGFVLCLDGDLGAGKTTFTKFLGKYMGIEDTINSPTFTIMKMYEGKWPLYHMDVYRLNGIGVDYELEEYIYGDGVAVIEWYHHIEEILPEERLVMEIEIVDATKRKLRLKGSGRYENIVEKLGD
jgi:tRNA threonylcarbamoyladenosine biosynthesis protein TsaE